VTGTLQAAIADPEIAARLGTLTKAERWSGFGEFGASSVVAEPGTDAPSPTAREPEPAVRSGPTAAEVKAARKRRAAAAAEADAAQAARTEAIEAVGDQLAKLKSARRRYEKLLESLDAAERELNAADAEHAAAEQVVQQANDRLRTAKEELAKADAALADSG
jgi:valyl-tRNA synthetase